MKGFKDLVRIIIAISLIFTSPCYARQGEYSKKELEEIFLGWENGSYSYDEHKVNGETVYIHSLQKCRKGDGGDYCENLQIRGGEFLDREDVYTHTTVSERVEGQILIQVTSEDFYQQPNNKFNLGLEVKVEYPVINSNIRETVSLGLNPSIAVSDVIKSLPALNSQISNQIGFQEQLHKTGRAMNHAYRESLNKQKGYIQELKKSRVKRGERRARAQISITDNAGVMSAGVNVRQLTQEQKLIKQKAQKIAQDSLAFRQYEFTKASKVELKKTFEQLVLEKAVLGLAHLIEKIFYQKNSLPQDIELINRVANDQGILEVDKIKNVPQSPIQKIGFKTNRNTPYGQVVRRVANKYQIEWARSEGLEVYTTSQRQLFLGGMALLKNADELLAEGTSDVGERLLRLSDIFVDGIHGFSQGMINSVNENINFMPNLLSEVGYLSKKLINDPSQLGAYAYAVAVNAPGLIEGFTLYVRGLWDVATAGSSYERGKLLGQITTDFLIGVATGGVAKAVSLAAKGVHLGKLGKAGKHLEQVVKKNFSGSGLNTIAKKSITKSIIDVDEDVIQGALKIAESRPYVAQELIKNRFDLLRAGNDEALDYIERLAAAGPDYVGIEINTSQILDRYIKIQENIKSIKLTEESIEVWRAVPKEIIVNGEKVQLTLDDVFKVQSNMAAKEHRYTLGGPRGHAALYTSGSKTSSWKTVINDSGFDGTNADFIMSSKKFYSEKILDLTIKNVRDQLGISLKDITLVKGKSKYNLPQIIGDLAKKRGYEVIKAPSAVSPGGVNYIVIEWSIISD